MRSLFQKPRVAQLRYADFDDIGDMRRRSFDDDFPRARRASAQRFGIALLKFEWMAFKVIFGAVITLVLTFLLWALAVIIAD